jgi:4-diphosphocytidyl-2-C-methyl-D-erythritol kinase
MQGALYAQMSGSGSAMFGIFKEKPQHIQDTFKEMFAEVLKL